MSVASSVEWKPDVWFGRDGNPRTWFKAAIEGADLVVRPLKNGRWDYRVQTHQPRQGHGGEEDCATCEEAMRACEERAISLGLLS
jgi:hypothetical protein